MRIHSVEAMLAAWLLCAVNSASAEVTKLAELRIPAQAADQSNLTGKLDNGMPLNQFGGIGALSWAGENVYYLLPDRGPDDGAVPYPTRFIKLRSSSPPRRAIEWKLLEPTAHQGLRRTTGRGGQCSEAWRQAPWPARSRSHSIRPARQ